MTGKITEMIRLCLDVTILGAMRATVIVKKEFLAHMKLASESLVLGNLYQENLFVHPQEINKCL